MTKEELEQIKEELSKATGEGRKWHLDKTISVSHILTTLAIAGSVFMWAMKMDQRVSIMEAKLEYTGQQLKSAQSDVKELSLQIRDDIRQLRNEVRQMLNDQESRQR